MAAPTPDLSRPPLPPPVITPRQNAEICLSGQHDNWDVNFARTEDLSNAIKFTARDGNPNFSGTGHHTLSIFGREGRIKFRDSRSLPVMRRNAMGHMRTLDTSIWASFQIRDHQYGVVRHEGVGDGSWITLIKIQSGHTFSIQEGIIPPTTPPNPVLRLDMLRVWNLRAQIQSMPYLQIVVRNYDNYPPWKILLQKEVLGPVVTSTAQHGPTRAPPARLFPALPQSTSTAPAPNNDADEEPLIDLFSEDPAPAPVTSGPSAAQTGAPVDLSAEGPGGEEKSGEEEAGKEQDVAEEADEKDAGGEESPEERSAEEKPGAEESGEKDPGEPKSGEDGPGEEAPVDPFASVWEQARGR